MKLINKDGNYFFEIDNRSLKTNVSYYSSFSSEDGADHSSYQMDSYSIEDYNAIKSITNQDFLEDCWINCNCTDLNLDFFDEGITIEKKIGTPNICISITTKHAQNNDLSHDKFTRNGLLESLSCVEFEVNEFEREIHYGIEDKIVNISLLYRPSRNNITIEECINRLSTYAVELSALSLLDLRGHEWKTDYSVDEKLFTEELLLPLLRRMNFTSVKYNHGSREFGKDIIIRDVDKFEFTKYYGIQVKAGNIGGGVNSKVDELIGQIKDAFLIPYKETTTGNSYYLDSIYIVTSGTISENAKEKILYKLSGEFKGSVKFIDREHILELATKYW